MNSTALLLVSMSVFKTLSTPLEPHLPREEKSRRYGKQGLEWLVACLGLHSRAWPQAWSVSFTSVLSIQWLSKVCPSIVPQLESGKALFFCICTNLHALRNSD